MLPGDGDRYVSFCLDDSNEYNGNHRDEFHGNRTDNRDRYVYGDRERYGFDYGNHWHHGKYCHHSNDGGVRDDGHDGDHRNRNDDIRAEGFHAGTDKGSR